LVITSSSFCIVNFLNNKRLKITKCKSSRDLIVINNLFSSHIWKFCHYFFKHSYNCYIDIRFLGIFFYDYVIVNVGVHYLKHKYINAYKYYTNYILMIYQEAINYMNSTVILPFVRIWISNYFISVLYYIIF